MFKKKKQHVKVFCIDSNVKFTSPKGQTFICKIMIANCTKIIAPQAAEMIDTNINFTLHKFQ